MNVDHKIEQFSAVIFKEAEAERDKILNGTRNTYHKSLLEIRKKATEKSRARIEEEKLRIEREGNRAMLNVNAEVRRKVIIKRDELINDLFTAVELRIREFLSSDGYKDWLINTVLSAKALFGGEKYTVYLVEQDMKYAAELAERTGGAVVGSVDDFIGGCRIVCETRSIAVDKTILSGIAAQRAAFSRLKVS